jgi:hypothetical protein
VNTSKNTPAADYVLGLTLGTVQEHSAVAVLQRERRPDGIRYTVRHVRSWDPSTSYDVVRLCVAALVGRPPLDVPLLAIGQEAVAPDVIDQFLAHRMSAELRPFPDAAGPERAAGVQAGLASDRLRTAALPEREALQAALQALSTRTGSPIRRGTAAEALAAAVALGLWLGEDE